MNNIFSGISVGVFGVVMLLSKFNMPDSLITFLILFIVSGAGVYFGCLNKLDFFKALRGK